MSSERLVVALDIGSSSVRASLWDQAGVAVAGSQAAVAHQFRSLPEGGSEADPEALVEMVAEVLDRTLPSVGTRAVVGVATSMFWHGVLGVDVAGHPTTSVLTWADRRSWRQAAWLRTRLDEQAVHARTGCVLHSSYVPAKVRWIRERAPEVFARTRFWWSPAEYLSKRLLGTAHLGLSMATGSGLFDQHKNTWDLEVCAAVGIDPAQLGVIVDGPQGALTPEWAARWPVLAGVPWLPAVGDGACSNVGSGCLTRDRLALMVGTSGALRSAWSARDAVAPEGLWAYRVDRQRVVVGGALSDGGNVVAWLRRTLQLPDPAEAESVLAAMAPDAHGLTVLPLLAGERGPGWADHANGAISGLSLATQPMDLLRAAMEAVALRFALVSRLLEQQDPGERTVVASGGGLEASPVWVQMMADALGHPVTLSGVREASSRGAALLAWEALGELADAGAVPAPLGPTFVPDAEATVIYARARERQQALYRAVIERRE